MIQSTLAGWHESTVEREKLIYVSLNNIDLHLDRLNGKVAAHEETILKNLPHTIAHCSQSKVIQQIHDVMIKENGIEEGKVKLSTRRQSTFNNIIAIISTIVIVIGLIVTIIIGKRDRELLDQKIENLGTPVIVNSRGEIGNLPVGDSLKYFKDGEFKNFEDK